MIQSANANILGIPYGMHVFDEIKADGLAYVDKTRYIEVIERIGRFIFVVRPRRFGKSLTTTILRSYYDRFQSSEFEINFAGTYIFDHKTQSQGQYYVLSLDFSSISTEFDIV